MYQTPLLPADVCIEELVKAGGNVHLAAERLFGNVPNAEASLIASIAQDPLAQSRLNAQLATLTTLRAFDALTVAQNLLPAYMADLEPQDFTKFYIQLIQSVTKLTEASAQPADASSVVTHVLQSLSPEARRAFITLTKRDAAGSPDPMLPPTPEGADSGPLASSADDQPATPTESEGEAA